MLGLDYSSDSDGNGESPGATRRSDIPPKTNNGEDQASLKRRQQRWLKLSVSDAGAGVAIGA